MKYLMYLVKESGASWDEEEWEYRLCTERPNDYENYRRVIVEPLDTVGSLEDIFRG